MNCQRLVFAIAAFLIVLTLNSQVVTNDFYNVNSVNGNGLRFWKSNNYKIHMGNATENKYGPVTSHSIKMNMSNHASRGWTWGVNGVAPVTALNTQGNFQTKGWIRTDNGNIYFKNSQRMLGDGNSAFYFTSNHSSTTQLIMRDKENKIYGRLIGAADGSQFGLRDGDNDWSYLAAKDNYTSFRINNSEKMRIISDGFVGIGTTEPTSQLHVESTPFTIAKFIQKSTDGKNARIVIKGSRSACTTCNVSYIDLENYDNNEGSGSSYQLARVAAGMETNSGKNGFLRFYSSNSGTLVERMRIRSNGKVRIGNITTPGDYRLYVERGILAEKVRVAIENAADWADDVFDDHYELAEIEKVEEYIKTNKHLPNVPSANEVVAQGLDLAEMDAVLLRQVEELWLHVIELKKENEALKVELSQR